MRVLINEFEALYECLSRGDQSPLSELAIQYADFAVWQREWLSQEVLGTQLAYWKQQLDGPPPSLNIITDRPRPSTQSYRGALKEGRIGKPTCDMLRALSRTEGATMFMTLLAAFNVLLHRYTGQTDLVVGTDIANRNRGEIERLIGFFVNQLVLRVDLSGNPTFQELLSRVRDVALGAYAHQDLPFEKLVEELRPERSLNRAPVFQVKMILQNIPETRPKKRRDREGPTAGRLMITPFGGEVLGTAEVDLNLIIRDTGRELVAQVRYSTDLFDEATILRLLGDYHVILDKVTMQPDVHLDSLIEAVDEAGRKDLINQRNRIKETRRQRRKSLETQRVGSAIVLERV